MNIFERAKRLKELPPYLFREIDRKKREVKAGGVDIIDLGIGDPDLPTPDHIIETMKKEIYNPANHRYASYAGMGELKTAVARWFGKRFGVTLEPEKEVMVVIGSKEGIAHLPLAFIDPGDVALITSPAYPVCHNATIFAGGEPYLMPLLKENHFLPDLEAIPEETARRAKLLYINYPNNPTASVADLEFFNRVAEFAGKYSILVCHDAAYSEMAFDGYRPPSFMQADGAMGVGMEFHSLSKTYNMTGWRIGFAVGHREAIEGLGAIKANIDSGVFQAVQMAGITALEGDQSCVEKMRAIYARRRDLMVKGLREAGFEVESPKATFYLWIRVPQGYTSTEITTRLLEKGVVVTPGNGFGEAGEGYIRMALTQKRERLAEAVERIKGMNL
jgi:LL-diaminopimelate aminotransferase